MYCSASEEEVPGWHVRPVENFGDWKTMTAAIRLWIDSFRGTGGETTLDRTIARTTLYGLMETLFDTVTLAGKIFRSIVTPPYSWIPEAIVESSKVFRLATFSVMFGSLVYVLAFGSVLFGQIINELGAGDRVGPGVYLGLLRELGTWLTYMILAGVAGSALAAELGARVIREEIAAMDVLGVDKIRTLIVPRFVAIIVAGLMLSFLVVLVNIAAVVFVNQFTLGLVPGTQRESIFLAMNPYDLGAAFVKHTFLGAFVGLIACQKGLSASGGGEGVGRAVAQTVLISFFGIWFINSIFNIGFFSFFPQAIEVRG